MKLLKYDTVKIISKDSNHGCVGHVLDISDSSIKVLIRSGITKIVVTLPEDKLELLRQEYQLPNSVKDKLYIDYLEFIIKKNSEETSIAKDLKHYTSLLVKETLEEEYEDFKDWFIGIHDMEASFNTEELQEITPESHPYLLAQEIDRLSYGGEVILIRTNEELTDVTCKSFEDIVNFYKEDFEV